MVIIIKVVTEIIIKVAMVIITTAVVLVITITTTKEIIKEINQVSSSSSIRLKLIYFSLFYFSWLKFTLIFN